MEPDVAETRGGVKAEWKRSWGTKIDREIKSQRKNSADVGSGVGMGAGGWKGPGEGRPPGAGVKGDSGGMKTVSV